MGELVMIIQMKLTKEIKEEIFSVILQKSKLKPDYINIDKGKSCLYAKAVSSIEKEETDRKGVSSKY